MTAAAVASVTGYSAYWIGQLARRYNREWPDGVRDRRHRAKPHPLQVAQEQLADLRAVVTTPHPEGDRWCGRTVVAWCRTHLGRSLSRQTGWRYLRRLGGRWRKPRPRHVRADPADQAEFKAHVRPLLRQVATAFPRATVELWAMDEHRIGLKPLLCKAWTFDRPRPLALVQHRFAWRYLVGFVHPASGRTIFHLATSVSIPLFEVELAAFARQVRASPTKQIVLVLDRAGRNSSVHLRVPEHVHLLFLPAYSPELQPAEHLWPLTNTVLANRHFASIDELEEAQAARCVELEEAQATRCVELDSQRALVRSTACFRWWPTRIHRPHGPRVRTVR
jgi:transposase